MVITKVNAFSVAKVAAVLYAGVGLLAGALFSLIGMAGLGAALAGQEGAGFLSMLFGVGAIIIMPICYAVFGFIGSFIFALLFNLAAGMTGGIEVETRQP
jgi:hypothetical protein